MTTALAADYKAPIRKQIQDKGYAILVNVGDQPSDFVGGSLSAGDHIEVRVVVSGWNGRVFVQETWLPIAG